jgi:integration host factor subunit beta
VTKAELIKRLAQKFPAFYLKDMREVVDIIFEEISGELVKGNRIELRGFGAFSTRVRKARMARNPKTNEPVALLERKALYFRAGKELKDQLNS